MHDSRSAFAQAFVRLTEPLIFSRRRLTLAVLAIITVFLGWQATHLRVETGFDKQLPLGHPYIGVYKQYQKEFGGANVTLVALRQKEGDIYNASFMRTLRALTDAVYFTPGMDRARVSSIFTPDVRYLEVVEGGFAGGNVVPADFQPTPESLQRVRANVDKAGIVGRLIANDHGGAMVFSELLERDPVTGVKLDYIDTAHRLEEVRGRFTSPKLYEYHLKSAAPPLQAGALVGSTYSDPRGLLFALKSVNAAPGEDGVAQSFRGYQIDVKEVANPDYNPGIEVHIIGFTKAVGDIADSAVEVFSFFGLTVLLVWLLLWRYCGSPKVALLPLACGVLAVIWELGLLHMVGLALDPFAVLMPFIVLAISTSHGIQITSFWLNEVADNGLPPLEAAVATYRRLVIPGLSALATNFIGFGTILLIPIDIIREMAINAMLGLLAIVLCKKMLLPCLLTFATVKDPVKFRAHQKARDRQFAPIWRMLSGLTAKPVAAVVLVAAAALWGWGEWVARDLKIGELHAGVPELRPDSRYNLDSAAVVRDFSIGVDVLKVVAEGKTDGCIDHSIVSLMDRFAWRMENTPGVQSTLSLPKLQQKVFNSYSESNPKFNTLPRESGALVITVQPFPSSTGLLNEDCSAMPVLVFTRDHKAETIDTIVAAVNQFVSELPEDAPVKFRLATGNVGVMAAANDVIKDTEFSVLLWLFVGIGICVLASFRSVAGLVCVLVPLALVHVASYAVMVYLEIGIKISNLAVAAFAAGIGVDYGIYIYSVLEENVLQKRMKLREAYENTLHQTGKAVIFTALTLAATVCTWLFSGLQFQVDMGILLTMMFVANAVAAVVLLPAFAAFLLRPPTDTAVSAPVAGPQVT
ncbi:RND family transporter [Solimonas sp. SE-A11]|uniref:efflux RND transporter permease subunit n=1 Tax=Solimonas sp. SE-A11 TaxID=3054954 RepID=UPI00259CFAED|nr:efflux RND transporter permease subunit [Solimonas sp. SE-A11]MDM4771808.1 efflux RND transporter permease subunit [Solimonas sp. SE-A11]